MAKKTKQPKNTYAPQPAPPPPVVFTLVISSAGIIYTTDNINNEQSLMMLQAGLNKVNEQITANLIRAELMRDAQAKQAAPASAPAPTEPSSAASGEAQEQPPVSAALGPAPVAAQMVAPTEPTS